MTKKPSATISRLVFSGGDEFDFRPNEKIIIVGPNNSGKSQSLREILTICQSGRKGYTTVISDIGIQKQGSIDELKQFLECKAKYLDGSYYHEDWKVHENQIHFWDQPYLSNGLLHGFIKKIAADDRLKVCEQQSSISSADQKSKPQHVLYDNEALMAKVSGLFKRAFGQDIMIDFRGGSRIPIHVGDLPTSDAGLDRVGDLYVTEVRKHPLLDKQGDGMKSYAGILFEAIVANRDVTLIDEPEAFLHPPQMRRLGETLSSEVNGQLIIATHSSDIMRGFLEGTQGDVRILRIRREGDANIVDEASSAVIKELWHKPELRYSNALEGIFHEQTIICEDDSDCRLINSVADYISTESAEQWQDTAYVPTGGKHGIPKVARVLRRIGVPVKAVFDIDFLAEGELVAAAVNAFGGVWSEVEPLWTRVDAAVRNGIKAKTVAEIKQNIVGILDKSEDEVLPKGDVIETMKQGKSWAEVKKYGARGIPKGNAQIHFNALIDKLEEIGIFLVPVGEIENFFPEIGSHGPKFVTSLLSGVSLGDQRLGELRAFVERVHRGCHGSSGN